MNVRIKELRKELQLSQEEFGKKLGITKSAISLLESGKTRLTEKNILAICREFKVNEDWLRTGRGDMFVPTHEGLIGKLSNEYHLSYFERTMLEEYLKLPFDSRNALCNYLIRIFSPAIHGVESFELESNMDDLIEKELEEYRKALLEEKEARLAALKGKGDSRPFSDIPDTLEECLEKYPPTDPDPEDGPDSNIS